MIKKVFLAQRENSSKGDFAQLVEKDLKDFGISYENLSSGGITKIKLKTMAEEKAFESLLLKQKDHSKVRTIKYDELKMQQYLKSEGFNQKEAKMLTSLRSNCVKGIRHNFSKMYKDNHKCPLQCNKEIPQEDTPDHILLCPILSSGSPLQINQIYGDLPQQQQVARVFIRLMTKRTQLLQPPDDTHHQPTRGLIPGPPIQTASAVRNGYALTY